MTVSASSPVTPGNPESCLHRIRPMMRGLVLTAMALAAIACGGGSGGSSGGGNRGGNTGPTAPDAAAGPTSSVSLCGSTTQPTEPCPRTNNALQLFVGNNALPAPCPCFTFTLLNQTYNDLGAALTTTYEYTGFTPGTYEVSGQLLTDAVYFKFVHNATFSAIGVVPGSIQSLTGTVDNASAPASNPGCQLAYSVPKLCANNVCSRDPAKFPANFSFKFTVATASAGGSC